jgi:LuxR family maltose regulon positive regulatory protein
VLLEESATPGATLRLPMTKFRAPRPRRDLVARPALLARLHALVAEHPVTLVAAPAGSGKTTLMAQLAAAASDDEAVVWVALDESDDDPASLLATLVQSLQSLPALELAWDMDPAAGVANVAGGGSEARAVLAGIVNALCTTPIRRVAWLLDDLQCLRDPRVLALLDALIERLPEHVALVLGSRTEPSLPLARLRVNGELGDLDAAALRFDEDAIAALAIARFGGALPAEVVQDALQRTRGWAVGVNLLLAARHGKTAARTAEPSAAGARALFDFLAQEVLDDLPPPLRDFAVDSSVLHELAPARCEAVTGTTGGREALEALVRRHLFLSVVDEAEPVLRFHDLFRDFLLAQLERKPAEYRRALHARAAAAETSLYRAIDHWLNAERWPEAIDMITAHGLRLAAEGAYSCLGRWIDRLPAENVEADPRLALLRAECAWSLWDWQNVMRFAAPAAQGLERVGDLPGRGRAQLLLSAALGALGHLEEREALTEASLVPGLSMIDAAQFHLQRAWSDFSLGRTDRVGAHLATMNALVATDPATIAPAVAQTFNCHFGGLPGVAQAYVRFARLCDQVPKAAAMPWQATPLMLGAWAALWQGRQEAALELVERGAQLQHSFGKIRYVLLDILHLRALLAAARGDVVAARQGLAGLLADLDSSDADGLRRAWQRPYRSVLARTQWMAGDAPALAAEAARLEGGLRPHEWPLVAGAVSTVRGQAALLAGDLRAAEELLESAAGEHARYPAPAFYADPRIALAHVHLRRGDARRAWAVVQPVLLEIARDATPGRLLLEPPAVVAALLMTCPPDAPEAVIVAVVRRMLQAWGTAQPAHFAPPTPEPGASPVAGQLTEREREVMELVARGLSNKHLARELSLSAHTVKRHLANILDKLDCDNRVQAAHLWRGGEP